MKSIIRTYFLLLAFVIGCGFILHESVLPNNSPIGFKAGDIIFISSTSGQGKAIQLATHSKYTHVGIVLNDHGKLMIYHAVEPVKKSTLEDFLKHSEDGMYELMRLKNDSLLTAEVLTKMETEAVSLLGKHYDLAFAWDDKEFYCSELVWKLYQHALGLEVGKLKPLESFDLNNPIVKSQLRDRYGKEVPLKEPMISPGDMHDSELLKKVN